ncbi:MAG: hypothetical protein QMB64_06180 [Pseudomonadales bacterium]
MARQASNMQTDNSMISSSDRAIDMSMDLDDDSLSMTDDDNEETKPAIFLKSTDVRRRLEERLEVRLLKDQLGIDDFDI